MKKYKIEDPVHVIRVCKVDDEGKLRPTHGSPTFEWPKKGPVEAKDFKADVDCGNGLYGMLARQILQMGSTRSWHFLNPDERNLNLAYLVVEVDGRDLVVLGMNKVKYPRGNVLYAGSWRRCLEILREKGEPCVPTENEVLNHMGWVNPYNKDLFKAIDDIEVDTSNLDSTVTGDGSVTIDTVLAWYEKLKDGQVLTKNDVQAYVNDMRNANVNARMILWTFLQRNPSNLFEIHPHVERLIIDTASIQGPGKAVLQRFIGDEVLDSFHSQTRKYIDPDARQSTEATHFLKKRKEYRQLYELKLAFHLVGADSDITEHLERLRNS